MSKIIKFTPELIDEMREEFEKQLKSAKLVDGRFSFIKSFNSSADKAELVFSELAYLKMKALVDMADKEVAWHGVTERGDGNEYRVSDIMVYPQTVTGATVDMDQAEYAKWIENGILSGDARFDHVHMQGHSHVNMAVSPSSTDLEHQREILGMVRDGGFYIFMIWNKKGDHNIWIYDLAKNKVFENADITVKIDEEDNGISKFLREAKEMVKTKTYTPSAPAKSYTGYTGYGGYGGYGGYSGGYSGQRESYKPTATGGGAAEKKETYLPRPSYSGQKNRVIARVDRGYEDDEEDDPKSPFYVSDHYYGMEE